MKNIAIASDHAGHETKEFLKRKLKADFNMVDFGAFFKESVDYPDFAHPAASSKPAVVLSTCNPAEGEGRGGEAILLTSRNSAFSNVCCPHPSPVSCFASNACRCASCPGPTGSSIARVAREGAYRLPFLFSISCTGIRGNAITRTGACISGLKDGVLWRIMIKRRNHNNAGTC